MSIKKFNQQLNRSDDGLFRAFRKLLAIREPLTLKAPITWNLWT